MINKVILVIVMLTAAFIAGAGCGGGSSSTAGEGSAATAGAGAEGGAPRKSAAGEGGNVEANERGGRSEEASGAKAGDTEYAEFVKEANGICTQQTTLMLAKVAAYVQKEAGHGRSEKELQSEAVDPIFVPSVEAEVREIRSLETPSGREAQIEAFLEAMEDGIAQTKRKKHSAATIESFGHEYDRASALADKLGISSCSFSG